MKYTKIILKLEAPKENNNSLELSTFQEKLKKIGRFLDEGIKGDENCKGVKFNLVDLSHSSPAAVTIEAVNHNNEASNHAVEKIVNLLDIAKKMVEEGIDTEELSPKQKSTFNDLFDSNNGELKKIELQVLNGSSSNAKVYDCTNKKLPEEQSDLFAQEVFGTIGGELESVSVHGSNRFRIYSTLFEGQFAECEFSKEQLDKVKDALGKSVDVSGRCFYKTDVDFPHKIEEIEEIRIREGDAIAALRSMRGMAPNATGDKTSVEFVRDLRDEWDG